MKISHSYKMFSAFVIPTISILGLIIFKALRIQEELALREQHRFQVLQDLIRRESITDEELALLHESQANSDHLVLMEKQAFAAMKGLFVHTKNRRTKKPADLARLTNSSFSGVENTVSNAMLSILERQFSRNFLALSAALTTASVEFQSPNSF